MWHMQRTAPGWLESLHILPDHSSIKATGGYEIFQEVKAINKTFFTIHRLVRKEWEHYEGVDTSGWFNKNEARARARQWFNAVCDGTFRDKVAHVTDAVSWHNEIWADSHNHVEIAERISAAEAAVHVWNTEFRPTFSNDIRLIIGEAAPGNGMPRAIGKLAIDSDNIVGYHPYEWWNRKVRSDLGWRRMTSQRFDVMEKEWGLKPVWAFTEAGPLESAVTGWRHPHCLGGDIDLYVDAVRLWIRDISQFAAYKEGRIRGFNLFTTFAPGDTQWGSFHTGQPEMNRLAEMIRQEWKPGKPSTTPPPSPPPTTPPDVAFRDKAWAATVAKQESGNGGLRLNPAAAIQQAINRHNKAGLQLQIVTDEVHLDGRVAQAAESLTGATPRRVYVWEPNKEVWFFTKT